MHDTDTFLTTLYVLCDDFCKRFQRAQPAAFQPPAAPGRPRALTASEVVCLSLFSQFSRFRSQRAFWRFATARLQPYFPDLPCRTTSNRLQRRDQAVLAAFAQALAADLGAQAPARLSHLIVDATPVVTRDRRRRGKGHLAAADYGHAGRLGTYQGLRLLAVCTPVGVISAWGLGPASVGERELLDALLAAWRPPAPEVPLLADRGFVGRDCQARWQHDCGTTVLCPPHPKHREAADWTLPQERWFAGARQMIETVFEKLQNCFGLRDERPHELDGLTARVAAKVCLHNLLLWLNAQLPDRPLLAFCDLWQEA